MSGEVVPQQHGLRMSDGEREQVVARLQQAVAEGRLTLAEFEERVDGVLAARTFGEVEPFVADLPPAPAALSGPPKEFAELRTTASNLRRTGAWLVPRRLRVVNRAGQVRLDFTDAVIGHPVVDVEVSGMAGSIRLVVPRGASVSTEDVENVASSTHVRGVPADPVAGGGPHFVVHGTMRASSLTVRHQRRFLRWRW